MFKDAYVKSQESNKLSDKRFGSLPIFGRVGKNAVKLDWPSHIKILDVLNLIHTIPYRSHPQYRSALVTPR